MTKQSHTIACQVKAADGAETEEPVPYRYMVTAAASNKCNCFKPNGLSNVDPESHKAASLGAVFAGNFNHILRQESCKHAALVWEAIWSGWCHVRNWVFP